ncbi:hypothetical protein [Piscinibacter terrae]|uniref:Uncharacterized protein n=1 Tax=Piscinibacter terrae TaxID=2496871 RepID=A0A3N7HHW5_9BURK|nr:hypothetical protein [Albitalea terrae]RQP21644.1 hypothetical protein DZC73_27445 [Albitalea terrae]
MRASAHFQATLRRFSLWRGAVALLLVVCVACLLAFARAEGESAPLPVRTAAMLVAVASVLGGFGLLRCPPRSVRWDSQSWHLGPEDSMGEEPWHGRIDVCLDLGGFMLLRFVNDVTDDGPRTAWLPVQRRGLESHWHALRCAVYSSRPTCGSDGCTTPAPSPQSQ